MILSGPFNPLDLADGDEVVVEVLGYEIGTAPDPRRPGHWPADVPALRIHARSWRDYPGTTAVDVYSARLIAMLPPILDQAIATGALVRLGARGTPPRVEYTVTTERP